MDGRTPAHTGAQNDEAGKIRGLLARGQEQQRIYRLSAVSYQPNNGSSYRK
jgi:hypothetical protein